jgi:hypothetical protein
MFVSQPTGGGRGGDGSGAMDREPATRVPTDFSGPKRSLKISRSSADGLDHGLGA